MKDILASLAKYKIRLIAAALGVILAALMLLLGFWRTLLIALLGTVGYLLGYYIEDPDGCLQFLWRIVAFFKNRRHL